jgi:hypothetical protein
VRCANRVGPHGYRHNELCRFELCGDFLQPIQKVTVILGKTVALLGLVEKRKYNIIYNQSRKAMAIYKAMVL